MSRRILNFDKLTLSDKEGLLWDYGFYLTSVISDVYRVNLHSLNGHLIEVWHNLNAKKNERIDLIGYNQLDKYLFKIDIITALSKLKIK